MEAPEKIYLQICGDCNDNDCKNCEFKDLEDNVTWCRGKIFEKDIEYTRTDAFIEKACKWIRKNWREYTNIDKDGVVCFGHWKRDFEKYMKE